MSEKTITADEQVTSESTEVQAHLAESVLGLQKLSADKGGALGAVVGSCSSCGAGSCL